MTGAGIDDLNFKAVIKPDLHSAAVTAQLASRNQAFATQPAGKEKHVPSGNNHRSYRDALVTYRH